MNFKVKVILPIIMGTIWVTAAAGFPFGPPQGLTIAPGDRPGISCTACHAGTPLNGAGGSVQLVFPKGLTYTPGQAQNISIVITDAVAAVYGFEMTARLESAPNTQQAGSFTAAPFQKVVCSDNQIQ